MQWKLKRVKTELATIPFSVEKLDLIDQDGNSPSHPYYRLNCRDWVNIVAITTEGDAILIEQTRVGSMSIVLETPGGVVDDEEDDPTLAAVRELEEETGYRSDRIETLGSINPNPAIMTNRIHMFLAHDCYQPEMRRHYPDHHEDITVRKVPAGELASLVQSGKVDHSLAALAILLACKKLAI